MLSCGSHPGSKDKRQRCRMCSSVWTSLSRARKHGAIRTCSDGQYTYSVTIHRSKFLSRSQTANEMDTVIVYGDSDNSMHNLHRANREKEAHNSQQKTGYTYESCRKIISISNSHSDCNAAVARLGA